MNQSLMETAREVNRKVSGGSPKRDRVHRYSKRLTRDIGAMLANRTQEDCLRLLHKIGTYHTFPGSMKTNVYEAASYFQADADYMRESIWNGRHRAMAKNDNQEFPVVRVKDFVRELSRVSPECKCAILEGYLYVGSGEVEMRAGFIKNNSAFRLITPKGMIILAYCLANGRSEDNRRIAKLVVDECERSGIFEKEVAPMETEPTPAEPAKMDYAETLRKLFDSVLTLVEKQAEERGAEKVIQQLKEAGKL